MATITASAVFIPSLKFIVTVTVKCPHVKSTGARPTTGVALGTADGVAVGAIVGTPVGVGVGVGFGDGED